MKFKTFKRCIFLPWVNGIFAGTGAFKIKRALLCASGYDIGDGTKVVGPIHSSAELHIGKNCWIGKNFVCNGNGRVDIADNCDIGPEVTFQTGGHEIGDAERRAGKGRKFRQSGGKGTWIGGRVTILGETSIGNACVVAGCACVVKSVGDNMLVGGVPARSIRNLECIEKTVTE